MRFVVFKLLWNMYLIHIIVVLFQPQHDDIDIIVVWTLSSPDAPKLPSVSVSPSAEIVEGSSVTLTCSSDANPAATYTWYKEKQTLIQGPEGVYNFSSISSEDRGNYYCKSENKYGQTNSTSVFIDVQCEYETPLRQMVHTLHRCAALLWTLCPQHCPQDLVFIPLLEKVFHTCDTKWKSTVDIFLWNYLHQK